jgi:hypothetical protein
MTFSDDTYIVSTLADFHGRNAYVWQIRYFNSIEDVVSRVIHDEDFLWQT